MARIRTIKPDFWQDEKLAKLDPRTRLVFLGLISQADDHGRLLDNVKLLDGLLFPETDDTCRESLDVLAGLGRILRYEADNGQRLIQIVHWTRHQKVDRPSRSLLPAPLPEVPAREGDPDLSRDPREPLANESRSDPGSWTLDLGPRTLEGDRPAAGARERAGEGAPDLDEQARAAIRAANAGMADNPEIGHAYNPIPTGHGSHAIVVEWLRAGIPPELIASTVRSVAAGFRPAKGDRQISSMAYFTNPVQQANERRLAAQPREDHGHDPSRPRRGRRAGAVAGAPGGRPGAASARRTRLQSEG